MNVDAVRPRPSPAGGTRGTRLTARRDEGGRERLDDLLEGDAGVGSRGEERAVERGEREPRELVGGGAVGVVIEGERDLLAQSFRAASRT